MSDDLRLGTVPTTNGPGVIPGAGRCVHCGGRIPYNRLMCGPDWAKVPTRLRAKVYAELDSWNAGTGTLGSLRDTQAAALAAIA